MSKCADFGVFSYVGSSVEVSGLRMADVQIGVSINIIGPFSDAHKFGDRDASITDSVIVVRSTNQRTRQDGPGPDGVPLFAPGQEPSSWLQDVQRTASQDMLRPKALHRAYHPLYTGAFTSYGSCLAPNPQCTSLDWNRPSAGIQVSGFATKGSLGPCFGREDGMTRANPAIRGRTHVRNVAIGGLGIDVCGRRAVGIASSPSMPDL